MHLLEKYSLNCGINPEKLGKPYIFTSYYPVGVDKYIVIHPSSGMQSKNYSYFQDIIDFIYEPAKEAGYSIVQIGEEKDQNLLKCISLQGKTNLHQTCFILKNASLFIGNDSFSTHVSSSFGIPSISLYSIIQPEVAGPYWKNGKQFTIMAPLNGKKPKYAAEDPERVIDKIKAEEILSKISLALPELNLSKFKNLKSVFVGTAYPRLSLDMVPNCLLPEDFLENLSANIRLDFLEKISADNIDFTIANISKRKCGIITSEPINLDILKSNPIKKNLISLIFHIQKRKLNQIDEFVDFISKAKKSGIPFKVALIQNDFSDEEINDLKFKFLNIQNINFLNETSWINKDTKKDLSTEISDLTIFKSSRIIFSSGQVFLSKQALIEGKPSQTLEQPIKEIKNIQALGKELESCYIYNL